MYEMQHVHIVQTIFAQKIIWSTHALMYQINAYMGADPLYSSFNPIPASKVNSSRTLA